ncbi:hypothetical protein O181_085115 [Austropuccinia psidii MF-1]|uniref:Uncharacterized protein n=1 Tax=Austropuccinia psidii MF-1 TaxID=1389203 RepID=A0A9Q3FRJ5_9BASI|nr:hypothetical protein [Austropuccinia psidii MF-1]
MSCHPWDSNAENQNNQIPHDKTLPFLVCLASKLRGNPLQAQVAANEPPQHNESTIPGQPSEPHKNALTCEPEPEVAPMKSREAPFACPATPASVIIINDMPIISPLPPLLPWRSQPPHSHNEAQKELKDL